MSMPRSIPTRRSAPTTAQQPKTTAKPPPPDDKKLGKRAKAIYDFIGALETPLAFLAVKDETAYAKHNIDAVSPYAMDIYTVEAYKEPLTKSIVDLSIEFPVLGAVLDKMGQSSPFIAIASTAIGLATQIAENHGVLPPTMRNINPSLVDREELARKVRDDGEALKEKMQASGNGHVPETDSASV